ncbi:hypothetical protein [Cytobacillus gottheilii]|uniref:hypothetical protein n=1 Tax=Cytobacillus gottheilii TaxID=859144 RepID=UPI00082A6E50|nr:hypothetical protein [Cytobacillus gottheilii]
MDKFEAQKSKVYLGIVWGDSDNKLKKYQLTKYAAKRNYDMKLSQIVHMDLLDLVLTDFGVDQIEQVIVHNISDFSDMTEFCMLYQICKELGLPWVVATQNIRSEDFKTDIDFRAFINF